MVSEEIIVGAVVSMFILMVLYGVAGYVQLRQIHAAVNSNMTTALNKIEDLHGRVAELVQEARHREEAATKEDEAQ